MAQVPPDVCRCRLVFNLDRGSGPVEQAIMGVHMRRNHGPGNPVDWPNDVNEIARKFFDKFVQNVTAKAYWPPTVTLDRAEVYHLDQATGFTLDKGVAFAANPVGGWQGLSNSPSLPWDVAIAVGLYGYAPGTFDPLAKYKRGRFYLPPPSTQVLGTGADTGGMTASVVGTIGNNMASWVNDLHKMTVGPNAAGVGDSMDVVVLSRTRNMTTPVTTCRVGRSPDTQRRRGEKIPEIYQDFAIAQS